MSRAVDFARAALDTLPLNVAVIDEDGEILLTNRSWDEFAVEQGGVDDPETLRSNYFAAAEATVEGEGDRAEDGIRAVLNGKRDSFVLEYPCHSPDERRWFLMRASPILVDGERGAVVAHLDITERKLAELAAEDRAGQLEHVLDRVNGLVGEVTAEVVHARSRTEAESVACRQFVATSPYRFAWVGRPDLRSDRLVPNEWAGDPPPNFEDGGLALSADDPTAEAYRTREVRIVDDLDAAATDWDPHEQWGAVGLAAVPLTYRSKQYGVLTAYAAGDEVFDERERAVLSALGRTLGTAFHGLTGDRVLATASVIEVGLVLQDPDSYLADLTAGTGATVTYQDSVVEDDGNLLVYATVEGVDPATVRDVAAGHDDIDDARVLTVGTDRLVVELSVDGSLVGDVADHQGVPVGLSATEGRIDLTATFPDEQAARTAFEHLRDRHEAVELTGYRERERDADTAGGFTAAVESALTDRQLTALRTAYLSGYFEWPRPVSGDEVAESMDITRATFHQHLREAQRKLATAFFESEVPD
ncbi:MAG: bacterio-opsin activator domain-containing protein [Halobacteriales archaeon]